MAERITDASSPNASFSASSRELHSTSSSIGSNPACSSSDSSFHPPDVTSKGPGSQYPFESQKPATRWAHGAAATTHSPSRHPRVIVRQKGQTTLWLLGQTSSCRGPPQCSQLPTS